MPKSTSLVDFGMLLKISAGYSNILWQILYNLQYTTIASW